MMSRTDRLAKMALLLAAALVIQYMEGMLPPPVPGLPVKLGIANVCTLVALDLFGARDAVLLQGARSALGPVFAGSPVGMFYSLSGAALSLLAMLPLNALRMKRRSVSLIGVSVAGAFFHSLGQLLAGALIVGPAVLAYFTPMELISVFTGALVGLTAQGALGLNFLKRR